MPAYVCLNECLQAHDLLRAVWRTNYVINSFIYIDSRVLEAAFYENSGLLDTLFLIKSVGFEVPRYHYNVQQR